MSNDLSTWTIERLTRRKKFLRWSSTIVFCCVLIILIAGFYRAVVHGKYQHLGMSGVFAAVFILMSAKLQSIKAELKLRSGTNRDGAGN